MKNQEMHDQKMKRNKRTIYDRSQIDVAVESVLKNKLSLRAASHIYKIPFSTLRTRKIFLEEHPEEAMALSRTSNSSFGSASGIGGDQDSPSPSPVAPKLEQRFNEDYLQELREKPLTLHNMKSTNAVSVKTEALIASLGLKGDQIELKTRGIGGNPNKKTFMKKPLKKRLKDLQPMGQSHKGKTLKVLHFKDKGVNFMGGKMLKTGGGEFVKGKEKIKKISKATLKNNQLILSSINARRQIEESQTQLNENTKYSFKKCRYFKCSECKLIFIDPLQLHEHQSLSCKQVKLVHEDKPEKLANLSAFVDKQEKFKCSFCKNVYFNKFSFLSHALLCSVVNNLL